VLKAFSRGLEQFDDLKRLTANLSVLLENPFYQDFIQVFLLQDSNLKFEDIRMFLTTLERVTALSNDWSYISEMMNTIRDTLACFDLNRFVAVNNETELENLALKLFMNGTFLAGKNILVECDSMQSSKFQIKIWIVFFLGIVFDNVKSSDEFLPANFAVKLRMNTDNVPDTTIKRPWYGTKKRKFASLI
jgi:hypothetical protein